MQPQTPVPVPPYPFSAVLGQDALKRALLLNAVDPAIGGALIRGERGTAKSTTVRALPPLLPPIQVVLSCPYRCAPTDPAEACPWCAARAAAGDPRQPAESNVPLVELPIAATEDRVAGSFDLEAAIGGGVRRFEPGLLAAANRGILYVDEVNLLPDHLIDAILDAASSGVHRVEREGISVTHPARFVLVGTMNPEEGDLRPQLLDRFGLSADASAPLDVESRAAIVRQRIAFDHDPNRFAARWEDEESHLRARVSAARALLPRVRVEDAIVDLIARVCAAYRVEGVRADIVIYRAAAAAAALEGRESATPADVRTAAALALPHRLRRQPFDDTSFDRSILDDLVAGEPPSPSAPPPAPDAGPPPGPGGDEPGRGSDGGRTDGSGDAVSATRDGEAGGPETAEPPGPPGEAAAAGGVRTEEMRQGAESVRVAAPAVTRTGRRHTAPRASGRSRGSPAGESRRGPYVRAVPSHDLPVEIALGATLRAAAPHQPSRRTEARARGASGGAPRARLLLHREDLRERVRRGREGRLLLLVVDASGSMAARRRMAFARGAVRSLLGDAYRARDLVGLIAFRGARAALVLPPTSSVSLAERRLAAVPTGGRTPLAAALRLAGETLARCESSLKRSVAPLVVLITDGRANVGCGGDPWGDALLAARALRESGTPALVIDTDRAPAGVGLSAALGEALGAPVVGIGDAEAWMR